MRMYNRICTCILFTGVPQQKPCTQVMSKKQLAQTDLMLQCLITINIVDWLFTYDWLYTQFTGFITQCTPIIIVPPTNYRISSYKRLHQIIA